jgi:hypothetical protein
MLVGVLSLSMYFIRMFLVGVLLSFMLGMPRLLSLLAEHDFSHLQHRLSPIRLLRQRQPGAMLSHQGGVHRRLPTAACRPEDRSRQEKNRGKRSKHEIPQRFKGGRQDVTTVALRNRAG